MWKPTFKTLEKRLIKKYGSLIFKEELPAIPEIYQEFIIDVVLYYFNKYYTEYEKCPENEDKITPPGRNRSVGDVFLITKQYFPNVSFEQVFLYLFKSCTEEDDINGFYCSDINKLVFFNQEKYKWCLGLKSNYFPLKKSQDIQLSVAKLIELKNISLENEKNKLSPSNTEQTSDTQSLENLFGDVSL